MANRAVEPRGNTLSGQPAMLRSVERQVGEFLKAGLCTTAVRRVTEAVEEQAEGVWALVYVYIYDGTTSESHFLLLHCWFLIGDVRLSLRSFWTVAFYGSASQESPSVSLKRESETLDNTGTLRTSGQMDSMCTLNEAGVLATSILHVAMEMARTWVLLTLSKTPATLFSQFLKKQT